MVNLVLMLNTLSKFQVGDHIRIPKYKNIFAKGYTPDWLKRSICNKKNQKYSSMDFCYNGSKW